MAKKTTPKKSLNTSLIFLSTSILLFIVVSFIAGRYFEAKSALDEIVLTIPATATYSSQGTTGQESAMTLATTITTLPVGNPLFFQHGALEGYVTTISKQEGRDVVILDNKKVILADTMPANVGTKYNGDSGQVDLTLADGQARYFVETSTDYPKGLSEVVVPIKGAVGNIMGAVIFSRTGISQ